MAERHMTLGKDQKAAYLGSSLNASQNCMEVQYFFLNIWSPYDRLTILNLTGWCNLILVCTMSLVYSH